eukprot:3644221-Prymnesium_polylepis.1
MALQATAAAEGAKLTQAQEALARSTRAEATLRGQLLEASAQRESGESRLAATIEADARQGAEADAMRVRVEQYEASTEALVESARQSKAVQQVRARTPRATLVPWPSIARPSRRRTPSIVRAPRP